MLLGGAAATLGPAVGVIVLGLISLAAGPLARALQLPLERFDAAVAALLLVFVLAFGGQGVLPWALRRLQREPPPERRPATPPPRRARAGRAGAHGEPACARPTAA